MNTVYRKVKTILELLEQKKQTQIDGIRDIRILPCDYREDASLPDPTSRDFVPFDPNTETWGNGYDKHVWFALSVDVQNYWRRNTKGRCK